MSKQPDEILFACDVGNSRAGFALVVARQIREVVRVPVGELDSLAECFRLDPAAGPDAPIPARRDRRAASWAGGGKQSAPIIVSSVNPPAAEKLRTLAAGFTAGPFLLAGRDFAIPIEVRVNRPEAVGVDRLLAALAAHRATKGAAIVVDVGTAVTVDALDDAGRFLGGAILPGPALGAWSLHQRTAALPEVALLPTAEAIGKDTEAAIRSGLVFGAAGAIERLVAEQRRLLGPRTPVIATGGGLDLLRDSLACLDEVRPNLVLEGLVAAYLAQQ